TGRSLRMARLARRQLTGADHIKGERLRLTHITNYAPDPAARQYQSSRRSPPALAACNCRDATQYVTADASTPVTSPDTGAGTRQCHRSFEDWNCCPAADYQ